MFRTLTLVIFVLVMSGCSDHAHTDPGADHTHTDSADGIHGRGANTQKWWDALPRPAWSKYERLLPQQTWFEVYRVLPDVYAIYEPHQFEEVISFLVTGSDKALLFDTGLGIARLRPVVAQLTSLDIVVMNSHGHYDHVGGNHEFKVINGLDHPYSREKSGGRSADEVREFVSGDWMAKPVPEGIDVTDYRIQPYTVTGFVDDGTVFDLGGRQLEVIRTPGHTPDSLCLIDRENRLLFTGDTFYLAPLYAHLDEANFDDYRASVNRLAALEPHIDMLMTAHNVPIADASYLTRLKAAFDAIDAGTVPFEETDSAHEFAFDGFSIIAPKNR